MATPELMTWIPSQRRWTKAYRGRRYYISARQLGTAETKEASVQAANQWWRDRQSDIDHAVKATARAPAPLEDLGAASLGLKPEDFARLLDTFQEALARRRQDAPDATPIALENLWRDFALDLLCRLAVGEGSPQQLPPARAAQVERAVKEIRGETTADPSHTVQALANDWLGRQEARAAVGDITPIRFSVIQSCLAHFAAFIGPAADVLAVSAESIESFYYFCLAKIADKQQGIEGGWSADRAKKVFETAKIFIRWLWEQGRIELPRNLDGGKFRFRAPAKGIQVWTPEEVRHIIGAAPGKLKLALLLMANCGMTQKDVSDLRDDEVNWKRGTISRKRSKTKNVHNVPVVTYPLWPLTFQLLRQYRSGKETVLLTETGRPFVRSSLADGKVRQADMFTVKFRKLCKRITFKKPMKQLRKTSATLLESHEVYGRFTSLFLGHAPASMKDRHYAKPPQQLFDEAVSWIGVQLGMSK